MVPLAFQGGTALRFLYSIRRYSEDLDFALERPERGYELPDLFCGHPLRPHAGGVHGRRQGQRPAGRAQRLHRFPGLLFELGLSPALRRDPCRQARGRHQPARRSRPGNDSRPPAPTLRLDITTLPPCLPGSSTPVSSARPERPGHLRPFWYLSDPPGPRPTSSCSTTLCARPAGPAPSSPRAIGGLLLESAWKESIGIASSPTCGRFSRLLPRWIF